MSAGLTFLNIILVMYLKKGSYEKEEQKQSENKREFMIQFFLFVFFKKYKHFPYFSIYYKLYTNINPE